MNSGYTKLLVTAKVSDIPEIKRVVALHYTLLEAIAELDSSRKACNPLVY